LNVLIGNIFRLNINVYAVTKYIFFEKSYCAIVCTYREKLKKIHLMTVYAERKTGK